MNDFDSESGPSLLKRKKDGGKKCSDQEKADKEAEKQKVKELKQIERKRQLAEKQGLKNLEIQNRKRKKKEYFLPLINTKIDCNLKEYDFYLDLCQFLKESLVNYVMIQQPFSNCITWERTIEYYHLNGEYEVCTTKSIKQENFALIIWDCKQIVEPIFNNTLISDVANIISKLYKKKLVLVIYKVDQYLKNQNKKQNYKINRKQLENKFVELQLKYNCDCHALDNSNEVILLISQYAKGFARDYYENENKENVIESDLYPILEKGQSVKMDKDGNGSKRLWQQQLCQFPAISLDIAHAICSVYESPQQLIEAYKKCSKFEGESLLKDIAIRRGAGPQKNFRKIGPEMSKKIFNMFASLDGDYLLDQAVM